MATDLGLLKGTVSDLLGLKGQVAEGNANKTAAEIAAQGDDIEAGAYGTAAELARNNANLTTVAGEIQGIIEKRASSAAAGSLRADVAGAGLRMTGSNLALLRNSVQNGYLQQQLVRTQTEMTRGGYLEQAAAADQEQKAAQVAATGQRSLADAQAQAASLAAANAANETTALMGYLKTSRGPGGLASPEEKLVTSAVGGDLPGVPDSEGSGINDVAAGTAGPVPIADRFNQQFNKGMDAFRQPQKFAVQVAG